MSRWKKAVVTFSVAASMVGVLAGCGGGTGESDTVHNAEQLSEKTLDLNPQDPATLVDGKFVWPLDKPIPNWNYGHVDGRDQNIAFVDDALMPRLFTIGPDQAPQLNPNYLTSAKLTSTNPEVVTYEINPKATWTDGTPITWADLQAQWKALNGQDSAYVSATTIGYEDVAKVEKGKDDREAKVTFKTPFGEWQRLFSPLFPKQYNATPDAFNNALKKTPPTVSAGPFKLKAIDPVAKTVDLERNPNWWGPKPVLSHITYRVVSRDDRDSALESHEITFTSLAVRIDLFQRAKTMKDVSIREAVASNYNTLGLNARPGTVMADPKVRAAVVAGVDPTVFTKAAIGPIQPNPTPIGNNIFLPGTKFHEDHTALHKFDPEAAKKLLDEAGWTLPAGKKIREKNGKPLEMRYPIDGNEDTVTNAEITQLTTQLAAIGAKLTTPRLPESEYDDDIYVKGDFDITDAGWIVNAFPVSTTASHFSLIPGNISQNLGQEGSQEINDLYKKANATFDENERGKIGNEIDKLVWQQNFNIPTFQSPDVVLTDKKLANFGAHGFADIDYAKIGFTK